MNLNYILYTGDTTITGSKKDIFDSNQIGYYSLANSFIGSSYILLDSEGNRKNDSFFFDHEIITGSYSSTVSINSQTLLEGRLDILESSNKNYYSVGGSGCYSIDPENSEGKFIFSEDLYTDNDDEILYNYRDPYSGVVSLKSSNGTFSNSITSLAQKTNTVYGDASSVTLMFEKYDVFFNGQKLYEGDYPISSATGKLFSVKKPDKINDFSSDEIDSYGSGFVENQVNFYSNGLEQNPEDFLQLHTGVYMIERQIPVSMQLINPITLTSSI